MEVAPPPTVLNITKIFSESCRIIKAQPRHFLALSFLFFFLPSVAISVYSIFSRAIFNSFLLSSSNIYLLFTKTLLLSLALGLFTLIFNVSAVGSITYSVINAFRFHGQQPLKLKSAIESIPTSFFPLFATTLLVQAIIFLIPMLFVMFFVLLIFGALFLGFHIEFSSPCFLTFRIATAIALFSTVIYLQVKWALSSAVVVAETTWGFESLRRSAILIKGRRRIALCLSLSSSVLPAFWAFFISYVLPSMALRLDSNGFFILPLVLMVLVFSTLPTINLLLVTVAHTVFYVYSNKPVIHVDVDVVHGEKFAGEYLSLPVLDDGDHEKLSRSISLVCSKLDGNFEV